MKVGSLVECIDDTFKASDYYDIPNRPSKGKHYFIRGIVNYPKANKVGVYLEEISNPSRIFKNGMSEPTFLVQRFREIEGLDLAVEELIKEEICA